MGYLDDADRFGTVREVLRFKKGVVEFARADESLADVARRMNALGISQMPIAPTNGGPHRMIHEADLLQSLVTGECSPTDPVERAAKPLSGRVSPDDSLSRVQRIFDDDIIVVVIDDDEIQGIISKIDLVEFLTSRS